MNTSALVRVEDVSKRFVIRKEKSLKERLVNFGRSRRHREEFWALRGISLDVPIGTTVGLVGHNGSGKSTLLKTIGGILEPSSGTVSRRGRLAALLELGAGFHPDLTGRENVYLNASVLGLSRRETDQYFDEIVDFSGIEPFIDTQVKFYSSGMYVRLAFAVAVHVDPDLLLVDEVLAVGDEPFQRKCMDKIEEFQRDGRTIILVSHSAEQVSRLCDRVVVLNHGELIFDGPTPDGLRVLRFGFEEDRRREEDQHPREFGPARIDAIGVRPETQTLPTGGRLVLDYTYTLDRVFEPLVAGIAIETGNGHPLMGINTRMLGTQIPTGIGTHVVRFDMGEVNLGGGQYLVRGSLETVAGESLDRLNPASTFEIGAQPVGVGLLAVSPTATVV